MNTGGHPFAVYCGRFAPSPTGPLHFGSLISAVASYLHARTHNGRWLVRMEDLDPPREQPGAADDILRSLEAHGLDWDGDVLWQSARHSAYDEALDQLRKQDRLFDCACSRKDIALAQTQQGSSARIYPGTCRRGLRPGKKPRSTRVRVEVQRVGFEDLIQGLYFQDLALEVGDFVLRRADGLYAYQLAVVVDDAAQGITEVVRGCDLLDSTPRQIYLQRLLGLPTPGYAHLPLATNPAGEKWSKQTSAPSLSDDRAGVSLWAALAFLGQTPPRSLRGATVTEILAWGRAHWRMDRVPSRQNMVAPARH